MLEPAAVPHVFSTRLCLLGNGYQGRRKFQEGVKCAPRGIFLHFFGVSHRKRLLLFNAIDFAATNPGIAINRPSDNPSVSSVADATNYTPRL